MECIKADAEHRDPQHRKPLVVLLDGALGLWCLATQLFKPWKRVTFVLDIMHVVGYLWSAANALCGEGSKVGTRWVQKTLTERMEGEGKRWSLVGAEAILTLRSLKKSHDSDLRDYWRFRAG
jgi:hypothetical protein